MNTIEDELRELFADPARTLPGWPDATARVAAGIARRRRRAAALAIGGATLVILVAAALSVVLVRGIDTAPTRPAPVPGSPWVIPWRDTPPVEPAPSLSPRPVATLCRTADLVLQPIGIDGAGGTTFHHITVRNAGAAGCALLGRPAVRGIDATSGVSRTVATDPVAALGAAQGSRPATIEPGESALLDLDTYGGCLDGRPETVYRDVRLRLADGGHLRLPGTVNATCGVGLSDWYRPAPPAPDTSAIAKLVASIQAPASARAGGTLDFVVTLTNPTGTGVQLDPCPNYEIALLAPVKAGGAYQLNCAIPAVPAHGSLRFAMRLSIPSFTEYRGPATVQWSLDAGTAEPAPTTSAPVTIET